jgi:hypothetical protein
MPRISRWLEAVPKLLQWNGWTFFFYSREGMPLEPPHVHVRSGNSAAKIWSTPVVRSPLTGAWTRARSRC